MIRLQSDSLDHFAEALKYSLSMSLATKQVHIVKGDNHVVAVERELVYDARTGIAAEVEKTTVAVDLGDGQIGIARKQKVTIELSLSSRFACIHVDTCMLQLHVLYCTLNHNHYRNVLANYLFAS